MIRTQIYIPDETHTKLTHLAMIRREPVAQIVREYVEEGLQRDQKTIPGNAQVLLELADMAEKEGWSGPRDLAEDHNTYLEEALEHDLERIHEHV